MAKEVAAREFGNRVVHYYVLPPSGTLSILLRKPFAWVSVLSPAAPGRPSTA